MTEEKYEQILEYRYERAHMRAENKEYRKTAQYKKEQLKRKLDRCTDVKEYMRLLEKL